MTRDATRETRDAFPDGSTDITQRHVALSTGVTLRVVEGGPAEGTPVLMLPGWACPAYMFRHAFGELPRYGYRVIVAELRGFGFSDKPSARGSYTLDRYVADLEELLTALGLGRVAIVGQSMGGALALRFALRDPDRVSKLVVINPAGLVPLPLMWALRVLPKRVMRYAGRAFVPRWLIALILRGLAYGDPSKVTSQDVDEYWKPSRTSGYVYACRAVLGEFTWTPLTDGEAAALAVPSMVMLGRRDRLISNTEEAASRLANSSVCWLPGGHCAHEEAPAEAYRHIAAFLMATA